MNHQFTKVTHKGYFSRILDSFFGIFVGILLFLISFPFLYWNEGRVNLSLVAKTAYEIRTEESYPQEYEGKLGAVSGTLLSEETLGDIFFQEGNYIALERKVEMYAWEEEKQTKTETNRGGSETQETTFTYKKIWTPRPQNSAHFEYPKNHENPELPLPSQTLSVKNASIGKYKTDMKNLILPEKNILLLTPENTITDETTQLSNSQFLFQGKGTLSAPEIGDIRISYLGRENPLENITVFGKFQKDSLNPFYTENNTLLYRAFEGTKDSGVALLAKEHSFLTWMLRIVGFLLMFIGLTLIFEPISVFLDILPFFGSMSRTGIGILLFAVALLLTVLTILFSLIIQNFYALLILLLVLFGGSVWYMRRHSDLTEESL
jgi:hypothetical protein